MFWVVVALETKFPFMVGLLEKFKVTMLVPVEGMPPVKLLPDTSNDTRLTRSTSEGRVPVNKDLAKYKATTELPAALQVTPFQLF